MNRHQILVPGVLAALVSGCTLAPKYSRPDAPVPTSLPSGAAYRQTPTTAGTLPASEIPWQEFFTDERLSKVIETALVNNRDLRLATLNVERSYALYGVQRSSLYPTLNASGSMSKQRVPADLSGTGDALTSKQYGANLGVAAWELDFFGRIRSQSEAAFQEYLGTQQGRRSAQILLVSGVADAYLAMAADRESLKLAQTTLVAQQDSYDLVKRRYGRGLVGEIDVHRAEAQVEAAHRDTVRATQLMAQDENALTLLVGAPVAADLLPADLDHVSPPKEISSGTSSAVLLRRPDIVQAEDHLKAANANIGAARAAFFPSISLTGAVGTASAELSGLFKGGQGTWSYSPQIVMPIFDARVWSAAKVTEVDKKIAIAQYEKAIQTSFREVADALAVRGTVDEQVAAQEALVNATSETYRLSTLRYAKGVDSYLSVLDAQRSLYAAQQVLVAYRYARVASQVRLYAVLGGGWQNAEDTGPANGGR